MDLIYCTEEAFLLSEYPSYNLVEEEPAVKVLHVTIMVSAISCMQCIFMLALRCTPVYYTEKV